MIKVQGEMYTSEEAIFNLVNSFTTTSTTLTKIMVQSTYFNVNSGLKRISYSKDTYYSK